ncbi:ELWxxDGT repeat protein [Flavobacterium soyangense]|uniref:Secretion system C-terminal sorting domain-containing protein n=1 Tax=Flavobacterium soyangense TaxID=2023265 RepID=A0A930UDB7_9FLAO|nr:ELWxxDGT repeat protein [Flavobacterium soyangense]MBF2708325.1 hypothetical protein [Flavobacterium soyangense]
MKKFFFSYVIFLNGLMAFCQNPQLLKDVTPGNNTSGTIAQIVKTSNYTFFNENDGGAATDRSLYRTDGTPGGTIKLNLTYLPDPPPSPNNYKSTKAEKLTALGNKVIFAGDNSTNYGEIWASDGTQAGTIAIERFQPTITNRGAVYELAAMNGYVYYGVAATNNKTQIKRTDGTLAGTSVVFEFSSYTTAPEPGLFKVINGILYFNLYDSNGTGIDQLWRCDGTTAGTYMLKDFGLNQYVASWYMPANSGLFYWMVVKPGTGNVLWKSDGTIAGTVSVKTIGTTGNNNYPQFAATIGDNIAFAGLDGNGKELWTTDGTAAGTNMVADINPGTLNSNPSGLIFMNNRVYFSATKADSGTELWESDGSASGTVLVKDINPGIANSSPSSLVLSNNTILFRATTATEGSELWITDGTASNTLIAADINPGTNSSNPNTFTPGNPVYFAANNGVSGFEVFKYNNSEGVLGAKKVWLTGTAFGNWIEGGVIKLTNNGGGIFTATNIQIIGDGRFKFTEGTWVSAAGYSVAPGFPTGVSAVPGTDITGTLGFWNVTYNFVTKAYSFVPTPTDNWGIVGSATPNDWVGPDMPLAYDAISNKWSAVVSLNTGEIKFRNNNNWSVNYGDDGADGSLDTNGANIAITAGRYLITLDFNTLKYTIKSALVAIPDPNFEQALIDLGIDKDGVINASISRSDAEAVTELNVNGKNINSLEGIQAFTNLSKLYCQSNQIQVLDIGNNKALTVLECGGNQLTGLNVSLNPLLKVLGFGINNISLIDVSQNLNLEVFWCNNNNITSQNLDLNSKLSVIGLSNNPLAFVSLKNGNNVNVVYFEAYNTPNLACINADAIVSVSMSNSGKTFSENCSTTSLAGSWIVAPETRALKVGPTPGSDEWWFLKQEDIVARACYLDDKYEFNENGSFKNVLGSETFLEDWQGVLFQCGAPVAPHNSPNATYVYNQNAGTITLNGQGAYLGLPKVVNGYELPNGSVPNSITYNVSFLDNGTIMTLSINIGAGFWTYKLIKEPALKTYYVNDNSKSGDVFTSAIGNNNNIGTKAAPFATLTYALSIANEGDTIYVDAGAYPEQVIINKGVTIIGAGQDLTSFITPSTPLVPAPGPFTEIGLIETTQGIGDVHIRNISVNSVDGSSQNIIIQSGGSVKNCKLLNGGQGIFFRIESVTKTVLIENNTIQPNGIGINCQGAGLTANILNNTISKAGGYFAGIFAGLDFGPLPVLIIQNNIIQNYFGYGMLANSFNGNYTQNSIVGTSGFAIERTNGNKPIASCNWFGSPIAATVTSKINGAVNYTPWLTNGTDSDLVSNGFKPLPDVCNGTPVAVILDNSTNVTCNGAKNGTINIIASNGLAPYNLLWTNSDNPGYSSSIEDLTNLGPGTYQLLLTDTNGSTASLSNIVISEPSILTASIANNSTACSNNATVTALAGTPGYTYLWSNGATTASINNVPVGTYNVTVKDANGCSTTASITLIVGEAFNPSASVTDVSCFGGSNGAITVTNANGTAPFTFSKDGITFVSGTFPFSFSGLLAGTYNIAVKDFNGCTGFTTKTIAQPASLIATIITVQSTCSGQSTGAISVATAGGSGALKYSWTGTGYTSSQKNISGLVAGSYTLTVIDNNGCTTILNANVPTYNAISVNAAVTNVLCRGSLTGAIKLTVSGGSGSQSGFAYNWTGSTTSTNKEISNLGAGTNYNVTITDIGSGCIVTKSYVITQPASNLSLAASKTNATGCGGSLGTITATASGGTSPYEYKLDNGNYQSTSNFALLSSGSYTVWVKDANGCTSSKVVAITDNGSDQYESNNSKSQAKLISIGTTINARIALATDTADWFKFTPTITGNYKLTITHQSINYTFNMYPSANNAAALVPTSPTSTSKQYALTGGTTYYVQITGGLSFNCYDLSILPVANPAKYASTNTKVIAVEKLSVKAYPNPHQGLFNLSIISPEDGKAQIELFSILGQLLAKREVSIEKDQNTIVEFNDVGRGIILYHLTIGNQEANGKVYGKD